MCFYADPSHIKLDLSFIKLVFVRHMMYKLFINLVGVLRAGGYSTGQWLGDNFGRIKCRMFPSTARAITVMCLENKLRYC